MIKDKQKSLNDQTTQEESASKLKPIQELKGFDFAASDAFSCDMETGICGPVKQDKETK